MSGAEVKAMRERLQAMKSGDTSVYSQLVDALRYVVQSGHPRSYELFEYFVQGPKQPPPYRKELLSQSYIAAARTLLNKALPEEGAEPVEQGPCGYVANILDQNKLFSAAGVSLGEECLFYLSKALQKLVVGRNLKEVKFWGKILGRTHDYYVAESAAEGAEEGELPPEVQAKGTGVNKMSYFVCTDLLSAVWSELPSITPAHIVVARQIKYVFIGVLTTPIHTNPFFPGTESHLLKAQIVRINFSCTLVPRTMFNVNAEDKKQIQPASEEWKLPGYDFLSSADNWVHHSQNILRNGRLTLLKPIPPQGVEVDEQKLMRELELNDPMEERLKTIAKDKDGWSVKNVAAGQEYLAMTKNKQRIHYGFVCIKSLVWRGWVTVYHNKVWSSIYVGYAQKSASQWYFPASPESLMSEANDRQQQPQPNQPLHQPPPPQQ